MADDIKAWDIIKYVVLPISIIGGVWLIFDRIFNFGQAALKQAAESLAAIWDDYMEETEEFLLDDETIDTSEQAILDSKQELMRPLIEGMSNAIPDPNKIIITLGALVAATIVAIKALKGEFNISGNLKSFIDNVKGNIGKSDPYSGMDYCFSSPEELGMIFRMSTIMKLADQGNIGLASNLLTAEQTNYFNIVLPQMQTSYNLLAAQLPFLAGMQLAVAQFQMTQYSSYLNYYVSALPPLFSFMPLLPL